VNKIRIDPLDTLFSRFIRLRAIKRVGGCERCLSKKEIRELQTSHFHGRRKRSVRWHEDNAAGLCAGCHKHLTENPLEHVEWFKNYIGENKFTLLNVAANTPQKTDRDLIKIYLEQKIQEVEGR
jgi:hypothetical protein